MRSFIALCLALVCSSSTVAFAQAPSAASTSLSLDPAYAAALLMAQHTAVVQASAALSPTVEASEADRRVVRRGRRLLAAGAGILAGSFIAGLSIGQDTECTDGGKLDRTAPIATSALLGAIGLTLTIRGGVLLTSVPEPRRTSARGAHRSNAGLVFAALGLSALSMAVVAVSAVPERSTCWSN